MEGVPAKPVVIDCRTVPGDIPMVRQDKATVRERIAEGAASRNSGGLMLGIVTGTESTMLKIAIGDLNEMIDMRIAEIEKTCGL